MSSLPLSSLLRPLAGLTLIALLVTSHTVPAHASPPEDPPVVRHSLTDSHGAAAEQARQATLDYWTPQRMAAAVPIEALLDDVGSRLPLVSPRPSTPAPPPQHQSATEDTTSARTDTENSGEIWSGGGRVAETTGKVFMTMHGRDLSCSAAVVRAENEASVLTAGHCLKDGTDAWAQRWVFVPGYAAGERPHGTFVARDLFVTNRWATEADDSGDVGMAVLHPNEDGTAVAQATGAQEIVFDAAPERHVHAFGYPSAGEFDGEQLRYCAGRTTLDEHDTSASGMSCQMTQGSSGGPWLTDFDPDTGRGAVSSVISFKYADDHDTQYGPRFGADVRRMYEQVTAI